MVSVRSIYFVQITRAILAALPVLRSRATRLAGSKRGRLGVTIATLLVVAFFVVPGEAARNHIALLVNAVSKNIPPGAATHARANNSASRVRQTTHVLASLVLLDASNSVASAAQPEQGTDTEGAAGFYLDTLPSVQGVAFLESTGPATQELLKRAETYTYTVEANDTPASIAELFGISLDTLLWANNLTARSIIRPGDTLTILPVNGITHVATKGDTIMSLAKTYNASTQDIIAYNNLPADGAFTAGAALVIPGGIKPPPPLRAEERTAPSPRTIRVTKETVQAPPGWLVQPAPGHNWGRRHGFNGVDIANDCGTPIVAAAEGTVIVARDVGWNGGYGKYIKIQHPNGVITLYAHAKELLIDEGVDVHQGDTIAIMGTTGRSTGCHVHFEVRGARNPFVRR